MKTVVILLLLAISIQVSGQIDPQRAQYALKVEKFRKMKTAGIIMLVGGGILSAVGITKINRADYITSTTTTGQQTTSTSDPSAVAGVFMTVLGLPVAGTGLTLAIIGSNRMKKYNRLLEGTSVGWNMSPHNKGVTLTYRF